MAQVHFKESGEEMALYARNLRKFKSLMNSRRKELKKYDRLDKGKKKKALTTSWSDDEEEEQDKYNLAFMARSSYSSDDEVTSNYLSDDDWIDDELNDAYLLL